MNSIEDFYDEIRFKPGGIIVTRAEEVLDQTVAFLESVNLTGLFDAVEQGRFADISRPKEGGKGLTGVFRKNRNYWDPAEAFLKQRLGLKK